jgi:hypothetical protein
MMPYFAQCVMCFRTAAAQQMERSRVLNEGILVLLAPPLLILAGLLWMARRGSKGRLRLSATAAAPQPGTLGKKSGGQG